MKKIDPAMAAALAASKVKPTRIETGANSGISDRQWYKASKGEISLKAPTENELIAQRHRIGNMIVNGLGEAIAEEFDEARWTARHAGDMEA